MEESSDEESGIPKPALKPTVFKNFNMDRLREVERQRQESSQTFEDDTEKKISCASKESKVKMSKKKDFVRINSEKFRRSFSISDFEDIPGIDDMRVRNKI